MSIPRPPGATMFVPQLTIGPEAKTEDSLHEIPLPGFKVPDGMTELNPVIDILPWMSPSVVAFVGHPGLREDGGEQILVCYEWPIPYFSGHQAMDKDELELIHVSRLRTDLRLASSGRSFAVVGRGGEPPDFLVELPSGRRIGLECTVLADSGRRAVEGLFSRIRSRLIKEPIHEWSRITGHLIVAWFVAEDKLLPDQLPHKSRDDEAIEALVEQLGRLKPGSPGGRRANLWDSHQITAKHYRKWASCLRALAASSTLCR